MKYISKSIFFLIVFSTLSTNVFSENHQSRLNIESQRTYRLMMHSIGSTPDETASSIIKIVTLSNKLKLNIHTTLDTLEDFIKNGWTNANWGADINQITEAFIVITKYAFISGISNAERIGIFNTLRDVLSHGVCCHDSILSRLRYNLPAASVFIAEGLEVSIRELNKMQARGEVTAEEMIFALTKGIKIRNCIPLMMLELDMENANTNNEKIPSIQELKEQNKKFENVLEKCGE